MKRFLRTAALILVAISVISLFACAAGTDERSDTVPEQMTDDDTGKPTPPVTDDDTDTASDTTENDVTVAPDTQTEPTPGTTEEETEQPQTDTTEEDTTVKPEETIATEETTKPVETTERTPETTAKAPETTTKAPETTTTEAVVVKEKTSKVTNIQTITFNDGINARVIGIYCETEPYAEVLVCDFDGNVLIREHALDKYFYGMYILPEGKSSQRVYIYAKADGKSLSDNSRSVLLQYSDSAGYGAFIGKDSHVFLNFYDAHYRGQAQTNTDIMKNYRAYLETQLSAVRAKTGKNTKIIMVICTNPATIYHDIQYPESVGGRGDYNMPTASTMFAEYMKDSNDIYVLDLREILSQHKDKLLFMQADSHWTQIGAYYGYYLAAQKVKADFPSTKVYDLEKDFDTAIVPNGGDLLVFTGFNGLGVSAATASVSRKATTTAAPSTAPTAYVMGDSYYGAISIYLDLMFSKIYLNEPETNPPLYDYRLDDLETKKPDYLFYIWTERNIGGDLVMLSNIHP